MRTARRWRAHHRGMSYNDVYAVLLVRFQACTGLRAEEVAGANIAFVNLLRRTVTVLHTWSHGVPSEP
jgi:hypothetical protein